MILNFEFDIKKEKRWTNMPNVWFNVNGH